METQCNASEPEAASRSGSGLDTLPRDRVQDLIPEHSPGATSPGSPEAVCNLNLDLRNCSKSEYNGRILDPEPSASHNPGINNVLQNKIRSCGRWRFISRTELLSMSVPSLGCLLEKLHVEVEEVSSELVSVLQERHRLQDEVDIRFIAIEQLLKVPGKLLCRTTDPPPLPPQISARLNGLPQTEIDALECQ